MPPAFMMTPTSTKSGIDKRMNESIPCTNIAGTTPIFTNGSLAISVKQINRITNAIGTPIAKVIAAIAVTKRISIMVTSSCLLRRTPNTEQSI